MLKDGRVDRSGGVFYNQFDRVRVEKSWKENIQKEKDVLADSGPACFQMNLANQCNTSGLLRLKHSHQRIEIVSEKEHKQAPDVRKSLKGMDPNSFAVLAIKHLGKKPTQKWELPEITSHDLGWMQGDFVRAATLSPAKAADGKFFGSSGKAPVATRSWSASAGTGGSVAGSAMASSSAASMPSKNTIVIVANDHILRRIQSAPNLPTGPRPQEAQVLNSVKWRRPMRSSDVTTYAEIYQSMLKHSPFDQAAAGR
jgi:hypothetical protein